MGQQAYCLIPFLLVAAGLFGAPRCLRSWALRFAELGRGVKDSIGAEELRSFLALIKDDDVGIFITTGGFSKEATDLARHQERRRITLIDQQRLVDLWIEYQDKVARDKRNALPLKPALCRQSAGRSSAI